MYALGATGPPRAVVTMERPPTGPAVAPDGTVYFIDQERRQIMRVGKDGTAVPVTPALDGLFDGDLAVGPDGDVYFTYGESRTETSQVFRLVQHGQPTPAEPASPTGSAWAKDKPGTVHTVAGSGARPPAAKASTVRERDGKPAGSRSVGTARSTSPSRPATRCARSRRTAPCGGSPAPGRGVTPTASTRTKRRTRWC